MWHWYSFGFINRRATAPGSVAINTLFWLISCHKLILQSSGVMGDIMCYQCVWKSSGVLSNTDRANDFCTPEHFNPDIVYKNKCPYGCSTTILYESDPDMPTTTAKPGRQNETAKPPMTFYERGCPKGDAPRSKTGCEEKSYQRIYQEECFCTSDLCNGTGKRWSSHLFWTLVLVTLTTFISPMSI